MSQPDTSPGARLAYVDALRVMSAALVVLVHANFLARPHVEAWWPFGFGSALLYGPTVPLFFVVAGFVGSAATPTKLVGRAARLMPLVVVQGALLLLLGVEDPPTLTGRLWALCTGVWQLYFLSALAQLLLLHALVLRLPPRGRAAAAVVAALATTAVVGWVSAALWTVGADFGQREALVRRFAPTWSIFYAAGVVLAARREWLTALGRRAAWLAVGCAPLGAVELAEIVAEDRRFGHASTMQHLALGLPYQLVVSVTALAAAARLSARPRWARAFDLLARGAPASLSVYLLHGAVLWTSYSLWIGSGRAVVVWLEVPTLAALAVAVSATCHVVAGALPAPLAWALAGRRR